MKFDNNPHLRIKRVRNLMCVTSYILQIPEKNEDVLQMDRTQFKPFQLMEIEVLLQLLQCDSTKRSSLSNIIERENQKDEIDIATDILNYVNYSIEKNNQSTFLDDPIYHEQVLKRIIFNNDDIISTNKMVYQTNELSLLFKPFSSYEQLINETIDYILKISDTIHKEGLTKAQPNKRIDDCKFM